MDTFRKIIYSLGVVGLTVWFGGSVVRAAMGFDLFNPGADLLLKDFYTDEVRMHAVYLYGIMSFYTSIGYGLAVLAAFVFIADRKGQFKKKGWMMMSAILFLLAIPVQAYSIYLDIMINMALKEHGTIRFSDVRFQEYFVFKFKNVNFQIASTLSFLSIAFSMVIPVWKPLEEKAD